MNNAIVTNELKYANDEMIDMISIHRNLTNVDPKDFLSFPCSLLPTIDTIKQSHHPRAWIDANILDLVAKNYYRASFNVNDSTYTRQPNLFDIKCFCMGKNQGVNK